MSLERFGKSRVMAGVGPLLVLVLTLASPTVHAQTCTTQAKMSPEMRDSLAAAATNIAQDIKSGDSAKVQADTIAEFASASAFAPTATLVQTTSTKLTGDTLNVTQIYVLDATQRKPGDTSEADFSCPLVDTTSETDFAITGLPPGLYGFAMVEAPGENPWLLSMLLRQDQGVWKLAGLYPKARTAGGHDGLWYWTTARADVKAKEPLLAWIYYNEAALLLQPASFVDSTDLDRLRAEQSSAAPADLINGIGPEMPLVLKATNAQGVQTSYSFTSITADNSDNGKELRLTLHMSAAHLPDVTAAKARNNAAASAFIDPHPALRTAFTGVWLFADSPGYDPLLTTQTMAQIP